MKFTSLAALVGATSAIQNFPPYHSFNVPIKVDVVNWPGAILPGDRSEAAMP
jgi:hypothetical protein